MIYGVELESRARREFLRLPPEIRSRIEEAIDDVRKDPRPPGARKLVGQDGYRIRVAAYRILYAIDDSKKRVRIYRIGHRRDIYRNL